MRVAFYAPLKAPDHPVPSGDRRMARAFAGLLASLGHEVELACRFRSYDREGDPIRQQRLAALGGRLAEALIRRYLRRPPAQRPRLWFTYHLYHKAPDWLGPVVGRILGIPYVVAEGSIAGKQAAGLWAAGHAASRRAIGQADAVLAMTATDVPGLATAIVDQSRLHLFPPFIAPQPYVAASARRAVERRKLAGAHGLDLECPWLLAVAMMRADVKLESYRLLARALADVTDLGWQLLLVGDGEARDEVAAAFASLGERVRRIGMRTAADLPEIYAAADLYVWPACREAYGMALLEAQAAGVPVVAGNEGGVADIVVAGETGLLVEPRAPSALAAAIRTLLLDPDRRRALGTTAQVRVRTWHGEDVARARLAHVLAELMPASSNGEQPCASA